MSPVDSIQRLLLRLFAVQSVTKLLDNLSCHVMRNLTDYWLSLVVAGILRYRPSIIVCCMLNFDPRHDSGVPVLGRGTESAER